MNNLIETQSQPTGLSEGDPQGKHQGEEQGKSQERPKAIILVNLGTPDEPTVPAVRRFLKQFLSDRRVVDSPRFIWWPVLNFIILPFRPKRVAKAYASIWNNGSPIREIGFKQVAALQKLFDQTGENATAHLGMSYGNPALEMVLDSVSCRGACSASMACERAPSCQSEIIIVPLYPQQSTSTTSAVHDAVSRWMLKQRAAPNIRIVNHYADNSLYIDALAQSVQAHWQEHGKPEKLVLSYHGTPKEYEAKGDIYARHCELTTRLLIEKLDLLDDEWLMTYQSRFGPKEWLTPYTDKTLELLAKDGVESVQVICPGFATDCLETIEEIDEENREVFLHAGGKTFSYIPALNANDAHIKALKAIALSE